MSPNIAVRFAGLLLLAPLMGCATIGGAGRNALPNAVENPQAAAASAESPDGQPAEEAEPTIVLSVKPEWGRLKHYKLPLTEGMTVQTALESQRLPRKFRNMDINVIRVTPYSNGQRVPLKAEYDTVKNCVSILHDMALMPGDHVMVEENNKNRLDELLGGMRGRGR